MNTALGDGTTDGIIKSLTDDKNGTGLAKSIDTIAKKFPGNGTAVTITEGEYKAIETAVTAITKTIGDTLEAGGLTELDTANLKTLRTAVENVGKTFGAIGEITKKQAGGYEVAVPDLAKVKEAMESLVKDLTESSTFAQNSSTASKNQAEIMLRVFYRLKNTNSIKMKLDYLNI